MNYVYTCQENTKVENGTESKEYSAVERDYAAEKINAATQGITLIKGGYIKTDLIKVNEIFAKKIKLQNTTDENGNTTYGSIYGGERYDENGKDNDTTAKGFYLGSDGTLKAKDGYFEGSIRSNDIVLRDNVWMPMITPHQKSGNINGTTIPITVDLETITASELKTILDNLLDSEYTINTDGEDTTSKRLWIYVTPADDGQVLKDNKVAFNLDRYTDDTTNTTYYLIGYSMKCALYNIQYAAETAQILLTVKSDGTLFKYSKTGGNAKKITFSYIAIDFPVQATTLYSDGVIVSRRGYEFSFISIPHQRYEENPNNMEYLYNLASSSDIDSTPRLCCIRTTQETWDLGIIWKEDDNFYINVAGVNKYTLSKDSTSAPGFNYFLL